MAKQSKASNSKKPAPVKPMSKKNMKQVKGGSLYQACATGKHISTGTVNP